MFAARHHYIAFSFFVPIQINAMTLGKDYFNLVKNTLKVPTDDIMKKADEYFEKIV